jgi:predicted DNA-binding protein (UPF0251 family)
MVTHKALDQRRGHSRRRERLASWGPSTAEAERAGHRGGIERVESARELQRLTRSESPRALTAARLHFVDGHTQEEVAQVLGVSRKTVGRVLGGLTTRGRANAASRVAARPVHVRLPAAAVRGSRLESMRASGPPARPTEAGVMAGPPVVLLPPRPHARAPSLKEARHPGSKHTCSWPCGRGWRLPRCPVSPPTPHLPRGHRRRVGQHAAPRVQPARREPAPPHDGLTAGEAPMPFTPLSVSSRRSVGCWRDGQSGEGPSVLRHG